MKKIKDKEDVFRDCRLLSNRLSSFTCDLIHFSKNMGFSCYQSLFVEKMNLGMVFPVTICDISDERDITNQNIRFVIVDRGSKTFVFRINALSSIQYFYQQNEEFSYQITYSADLEICELELCRNEKLCISAKFKEDTLIVEKKSIFIKMRIDKSSRIEVLEDVEDIFNHLIDFDIKSINDFYNIFVYLYTYADDSLQISNNLFDIIVEDGIISKLLLSWSGGRNQYISATKMEISEFDLLIKDFSFK